MDEYTVNIDTILESKETMSCVKDLFRSVKENGYITPKTYFESISDLDLNTLMQLADRMNSEESTSQEQFEAQEHIMLMTIGLLVGEGTEINEETVVNGSSLVVLMITCESLARKGLVKPHRDNWCMTGEQDKIWVERI